MEFEKSELINGNVSLEEKIDYILSYRESIGKPIDLEWLLHQPKKIINGIYYEILNKKKNKSAEDSNQLTIDEVYSDLISQQLEDEINDALWRDFMAGNFEIKDKTDDIYDEEGHLLNDIQRLERRENAKRYR